MIGTTLDDRYAILRLIGKGGMGAVYEARNTRTNRRVAIKVIQGQMDAAHIARFQREASVVGAVDSQHITLVYDTGVDRNTNLPYIAMEMLDGEDVDEMVDRLGPLPVDLALRIAYQACLGLEAAHKIGIVHRDIKGANLFLHKREGGERVVKILDFGIAKSTGTEVPHAGLTQTGTVLGSPLYMSPEQAKGGHIDARSDLWSLGITLYEMLCGSQPLVHIQQLGELIIAICTAPVPSLQTRAPHLPPQVVELVHRALQIDPAHRYQSAAEMAQTIRAFLPHGTTVDESMVQSAGQPHGAVPLQSAHGGGSYAQTPQAAMAPRPPFGSAPAMDPHAGHAPGQTGPHRPQFGSAPIMPPLVQAPGQTGPQRPQFGSSPMMPPLGGPVPGQTSPQMGQATGSLAYGTTAAVSAQKSGGSKVPLIIGGIGVLAIVGIGAAFALRGGPDKPLPTNADTSATSTQATNQPAIAPLGTPGEPATTQAPPPSYGTVAAPIASTTSSVRYTGTAPPSKTSTVKRPTKDEETSRK